MRVLAGRDDGVLQGRVATGGLAELVEVALQLLGGLADEVGGVDQRGDVPHEAREVAALPLPAPDPADGDAELRERGFFTDRPEPNFADLLDLVALGTVADVAALHGLNRAFVAQGLKVLKGQDHDKAAKIQPIFITIDPERDTKEVVGEFAAAFSPDIIGLTGTPDQIAAAAELALGKSAGRPLAFIRGAKPAPTETGSVRESLMPPDWDLFR